MSRFKTKTPDDERFHCLYKRIRRIEVFICFQAILFSGYLFNKSWNTSNFPSPSGPSLIHETSDIEVVKQATNNSKPISIDHEEITPSNEKHNMKKKEPKAIRKRPLMSLQRPKERHSSKSHHEIENTRPPYLELREITHIGATQSIHLDRRNLQLNQAKTRKCDSLPFLSPISRLSNFTFDTRVAEILGVLYSMVTLEIINNKFSARYRAACWILFDDELQITGQDPLLNERYALAVLIFSMFDKGSQTQLPLLTCDYDFVKCDDSGHIIEIVISKLLVSTYVSLVL